MYTIINLKGLPCGSFEFYYEAVERVGKRKGLKIIKKEFIKGRWTEVTNPQLTL